jgi:hypothetical protein
MCIDIQSVFLLFGSIIIIIIVIIFIIIIIIITRLRAHVVFHGVKNRQCAECFSQCLFQWRDGGPRTWPVRCDDAKRLIKGVTLSNKVQIHLRRITPMDGNQSAA